MYISNERNAGRRYMRDNTALKSDIVGAGSFTMLSNPARNVRKISARRRVAVDERYGCNAKVWTPHVHLEALAYEMSCERQIVSLERLCHGRRYLDVRVTEVQAQ